MRHTSSEMVLLIRESCKSYLTASSIPFVTMDGITMIVKSYVGQPDMGNVYFCVFVEYVLLLLHYEI